MESLSLSLSVRSTALLLLHAARPWRIEPPTLTGQPFKPHWISGTSFCVTSSVCAHLLAHHEEKNKALISVILMSRLRGSFSLSTPRDDSASLHHVSSHGDSTSLSLSLFPPSFSLSLTLTHLPLIRGSWPEARLIPVLFIGGTRDRTDPVHRWWSCPIPHMCHYHSHLIWLIDFDSATYSLPSFVPYNSMSNCVSNKQSHKHLFTSKILWYCTYISVGHWWLWTWIYHSQLTPSGQLWTPRLIT